MSEATHSQAPHYLPGFLPGPDGGDPMFTVVAVFFIGLILIVGVAYFTLHALPEKMAHRANSAQLQLISILVVLALFTHNNLFWVAALLLAAVRVPDIATPLESIARSLEGMGGAPIAASPREPAPEAQPEAEPAEQKAEAPKQPEGQANA